MYVLHVIVASLIAAHTSKIYLGQFSRLTGHGGESRPYSQEDPNHLGIILEISGAAKCRHLRIGRLFKRGNNDRSYLRF